MRGARVLLIETLQSGLQALPSGSAAVESSLQAMQQWRASAPCCSLPEALLWLLSRGSSPRSESSSAVGGSGSYIARTTAVPHAAPYVLAEQRRGLGGGRDGLDGLVTRRDDVDHLARRHLCMQTCTCMHSGVRETRGHERGLIATGS